MGNCNQYCVITKCPILNKDQCPIRKLWEGVEAKEKEADKLAVHLVHAGKFSNN